MNIQPDTVATIDYRIADERGKPVPHGTEPIVYLHGGYDNILPKLEAALADRAPGDRVTVSFEPGEAFGNRDEALMQTISKADFPPGVKVGGQLEGRGEDGQAHVFTVLKIKGDNVLLDGNHPLAGRALRFDLKVLDVRPATPEEIAHRHVHGETDIIIELAARTKRPTPPLVV